MKLLPEQICRNDDPDAALVLRNGIKILLVFQVGKRTFIQSLTDDITRLIHQPFLSLQFLEPADLLGDLYNAHVFV